MSEPFLSEIRLMSFNFPPRGWAFCNGQMLPINQNQALFSLLGTTYGGNGQTTFALPNLQGRVPLHRGGGHVQGEAAGSNSVTLNIQQLPLHHHSLRASSASTGGTPSPANAFLGGASNVYRAVGALTTLHAESVTALGGSQPHENRQPYLALNFCIALTGVFPSQN